MRKMTICLMHFSVKCEHCLCYVCINLWRCHVPFKIFVVEIENILVFMSASYKKYCNYNISTQTYNPFISLTICVFCILVKT